MSTTETAFDSLYAALKYGGFNVRSYSGRGMYGKSCVAVYVDDATDLLKIGVTIGETYADLRAATDSMGRGMVVYWPSQTWEDTYEDSDDIY